MTPVISHRQDNGSLFMLPPVLTTSMAHPGISSTEAVAHWLPWQDSSLAQRCGLKSPIRGTSPSEQLQAVANFPRFLARAPRGYRPPATMPARLRSSPAPRVAISTSSVLARVCCRHSCASAFSRSRKSNQISPPRPEPCNAQLGQLIQLHPVKPFIVRTVNPHMTCLG